MVFLYLYNQKGGKKDNRNRLDVPPNRFDFDASARVRFLNEKDTHKKRPVPAGKSLTRRLRHFIKRIRTGGQFHLLD